MGAISAFALVVTMEKVFPCHVQPIKITFCPGPKFILVFDKLSSLWRGVSFSLMCLKKVGTGRIQRRCCMDFRQVGFVALSMRVLNTTPGFQDSSNPHENSRISSDPGTKVGSGVLHDSTAKIVTGTGAAVSNAGTMRGATDFG